MFDEINMQLEEAGQKVFRWNKLRSMINDMEQQKKELVSKAAILKEILDKEDTDVERLEGKSLSHLLHSLLGNLDERLRKEQQEALAARLKYDQALKELQTIEGELALREAELMQYGEVQRDYQSLFERKKEMLLTSGTESAETIIRLSQDIASSKNVIKEIEEAVHAGNRVMSHLDSAMKSLDSAEGWGTWDLLGGGLVSDLMKHSNIDDAKAEVDEVQRALNSFRTELADVKINHNIQIDTEGFGKFADFFFDGLIADWCMQSRIHDSQASVENVRGEVQTVLHRLGSMEGQLKNHIIEQEQEINRLIQGAV